MKGKDLLASRGVAARIAVWAAGTLLATAGCGGEAVECAAGTVVQDGKCVTPGPSSCGAGTVWEATSKQCVLAPSDVADDSGAPADSSGASDGAEQDSAEQDTVGGDGADSAQLPDSLTPDIACTPSCDGRVCGNDGCGGSCGDCPNGKACTAAGACIDPPGCFPSCFGKLCGDDGCGGSCGTCADPNKPLCEGGVCLAGCVPDCLGKDCGDDDCGGTCGTCGGDTACSSHGHCVAKAWTCDEANYGGKDGCHCGCGASDPDCGKPGQYVIGCGVDQVCKDGACVDKVPKAWKCPAFLYADGLLCNCTCGAPDPDCDASANFIADCSVGGCDKKAGQCLACTPNCANKVCGDDGCGGSCGTCSDPKLPNCTAGACVDKCTPSCANKECGDDGCGGSCGVCKNKDHVCSAGLCAPPPDKSCLGLCGAQAKGGCWCDAACKDRGDCCSNVNVCYCVPSCEDVMCGSDGCGGSCGTCTDKAAPYCNGGQCEGTCKPQCTGKTCGPDGCGGSCGSCGAGTTCQDWGRCVPDAWHCAKHLYAGGGVSSTCDCGCGAPDPDCKGKGVTEGCPDGAACAADKGVCEATWCNSQGACKSPAWCVGDYPVGDGSRKGICAPPDPLGFAPGHTCTTDAACATGLCHHFSCRIHCSADSECPKGQACAGTDHIHPLTGHRLGVISVCHPAGAVGKSCAAHKDCPSDELCLAFVEPKTLKPMARCGVPYGGSPEGLPCGDGAQCQAGLLCAGGACARPCHGGAADCPAGKVCQPATLHGGATSSPDDDVKVPACVNK